MCNCNSIQNPLEIDLGLCKSKCDKNVGSVYSLKMREVSISKITNGRENSNTFNFNDLSNTWNNAFLNQAHPRESVTWQFFFDQLLLNSGSDIEDLKENHQRNCPPEKENFSNSLNSNFETDGVQFECSQNSFYVSSMDTKTLELSSNDRKFKESGCPSAKKKNSRKVKKSKQNKPTICLEPCAYELVATTAKKFGMKIVDTSGMWDIYWSDACSPIELANKMKRYQRTNHFPGIFELCRKNLLAKNLNHMKCIHPEAYNFFPKTWILPKNNREVHAYINSKKATVIVKPENGSNGAGIYLARNFRHIQAHQDSTKNYICQAYISNPFLIDGYKFDIRVYTLITSCDPLRLYVHNDGIVRFATVKYEKPNQKNIKKLFMHLTNYSLNKHSMSFIVDDEIGSKRKISTLNEWFTRHEYNVREIWSRIDDVIVKTVLSAYPEIKSQYKSCFPNHNYCTACFQLLGLDILLDESLNPYVLEVNHSPSFHTDSPLDLDIKEKILNDTFVICNLNKSIKAKVIREDRIQAQKRLFITKFHRKYPPKLEEFPKQNKESQWLWEKNHIGNFRLVYPCSDENKYDSILFDLGRTFIPYKDTVASTIRTKFARSGRQNIESKTRKENTTSTNENLNKNNKNVDQTKNKVQTQVLSGVIKKPSENLKKQGNCRATTEKGKQLPKPIPISNRESNTNKKLREHSSSQEEKERLDALKQRKAIVEDSGVREFIYTMFEQMNNLRGNDRKQINNLRGSDRIM